MANAAAKKAAQQRKQTTSVYFPIIVALNAFHLFLLYALASQSFTKTRIAVTVFEWIGTYIAYQGIIHDAEVSNLTRNSRKHSKWSSFMSLITWPSMLKPLSEELWKLTCHSAESWPIAKVFRRSFSQSGHVAFKLEYQHHQMKKSSKSWELSLRRKISIFQ